MWSASQIVLLLLLVLVFVLESVLPPFQIFSTLERLNSPIDCTFPTKLLFCKDVRP
jgi:hypothetical protein